MIQTRIAIIFVALGVFAITTLAAADPVWVDTYGADTPYSRDAYLTGFAVVSNEENRPMEMARDLALADLSGKIRTKIQSELVQIATESSEADYSSSVSQITRNSVNVTVNGSEYTYHEKRRDIYALAYVSIDSLLEAYNDEASAYWSKIRQARRDAVSLAESGNTDRALQLLYEAAAVFPNLYERWTLIRSIGSPEDEKVFFRGLPRVYVLSDLYRNESEIESLIDELTDREASSLNEALGMIAIMMDMQGVSGGRITVPPLLFESTTFSSEFGRYSAGRLESELVDRLTSGNNSTVFRGQYWEEEGHIRLIVLATDVTGEKMGRGEVVIPTTAAGGRSLKPQGFDEAMTALMEFSDGAVSDGGLNVDVWTNKGRDEDALIFTDGEIIQLYFRVNQPAHLQITYRLATGELVLMEESFYIGSDRVNRTVALPYEFEVQPPFGIENLIVTAFSVEPPAASIVPTTISGELYNVFSSMGDVVANTRGIARRQNSESEQVRVGEAMLTMTMMKE